MAKKTLKKPSIIKNIQFTPSDETRETSNAQEKGSRTHRKRRNRERNKPHLEEVNTECFTDDG